MRKASTAKRPHHQLSDHGVSSRGREIDPSLTSSASLLTSLVDPNFDELASRFPSFRQAYNHVLQQQQQQQQGKGLSACITQDFSIALTKALLHTHWGISLTHLPLHHLCPPVPNRYFLIHWIQQTLLPCLLSHEHYLVPKDRLCYTGLDIGTGATCIYPLLFMASLRKQQQQRQSCWKLWATDIDKEAIELANANVQSNQMQEFIQPVVIFEPLASQQYTKPHCETSGNALTQQQLGPFCQSLSAMATFQQMAGKALQEPFQLDFCLTNPPFYGNDEERMRTRQGDGRSRTCMTVHEGTYPGGEIGFCTDIMVDQCRLLAQGNGNSNRNGSKGSHPISGWTVVMCGKKSSFTVLHHMACQMVGISHVSSAEFGPGQLTRWFLAWSWHPRPQPTSPLAALDRWEFTVTLDCKISSNTHEVTQRLMCYAQEHSLQAQDITAEPNGDSRYVELWQQNNDPQVLSAWMQEDKNLPKHLESALSDIPATVRSELLPPQGQFYVTIAVYKAQQAASCAQHQQQLRVEAFSHTPAGKRVVAKIKQQLPGEIGRTNRKWRRKQQRERMEQD